jgi:hypothetical protein
MTLIAEQVTTLLSDAINLAKGLDEHKGRLAALEDALAVAKTQPQAALRTRPLSPVDFTPEAASACPALPSSHWPRYANKSPL